MIEVQQPRAIVSPADDDGSLTEADILAIHQARFARLHAGTGG